MHRIFYWVSGCQQRSRLSINLQLRVQCFVMLISDVDECLHDETLCNKVNEKCLNQQGSFFCVCRSGYRRVNKLCVKKGERSKLIITIEQIDVRFSCACPIINNEFPFDIVKVRSCRSIKRQLRRSAYYFDNIVTEFIVNNITDA